MFRLLYARSGDEPDDGEPDSWDREKRLQGFRTFRNETVRSQGERMIADWLFLNGVDYRYEHPYSFDTATSDHSQYRPDFYYPAADVWHEHWALDANGIPPPSFHGYAEGMDWKRRLHLTHGTTLIESTWAQIWNLTGFDQLAHDLSRHEISLDWNPDRPIPGAKPIHHKDLCRLVRTFMTHVKSSSLTPKLIESRLKSTRKRLRTPRTELFLKLYWPIHEEWNRQLREGQYVDFEDMLLQAAEHLENGKASSAYDLVLVDEFQDSSQARTQMVKALVSEPGRFLLTVGDDWQAINRFAGADISSMTEFENHFGRHQTVQLETTFRCTQEICDVSSTFISKNPRQLPKIVKSFQDEPGVRVKVLKVKDQADIKDAVGQALTALQDSVDSGSIELNRDGRISVQILGRYNFDQDHVPQLRDAPLPDIDASFRTIHSAKGLEADYIIVPNLMRGTYGFPSAIADDPVLDLAMSDADDFKHAEERRLFYVALTRARRDVLLIAVDRNESSFVVELIEDGLVAVVGEDPEAPALTCPTCHEGMLVLRSGPYGEFLGCTSFPRCRHVQKL